MSEFHCTIVSNSYVIFSIQICIELDDVSVNKKLLSRVLVLGADRAEFMKVLTTCASNLVAEVASKKYEQVKVGVGQALETAKTYFRNSGFTNFFSKSETFDDLDDDEAEEN